MHSLNYVSDMQNKLTSAFSMGVSFLFVILCSVLVVPLSTTSFSVSSH